LDVSASVMPSPTSAPIHLDLRSLGEPVYRGSVQHLYAVPDHPGYVACETTEAGSVFDVGSIFKIEGNDLNRALFRHAMYARLAQPETWQRVKKAIEATAMDAEWRRELLSGPLEQMLEHGALTHHLGMVDAGSGEIVREGMPKKPSCFNVVRRFPVMHPPQRTLLGAYVFDYAQFHQSSSYVVPLEYIVRFGITSGSSVLKKYLSLSDAAKRTFEQELGLRGPMQTWSMLENPIYDLTSKYEPEDRAVSKQEALIMSGLSSEHFLSTVKMAILGGWAVRELLESAGLQLWDLKWEFAVDGDDLLFVDTIDADSFRGTGYLEVEGRKLVIHYNKQAMRDYYRLAHPAWFTGINEAKKAAQLSGQPFKQVLRDGQAAGKYPATPVVDATFLDIQARKTSLLREQVLATRPAETIRAELIKAAEAETAFYREKGLLKALLEMNAV
jgi:phosphoribosylaminoimidazole-succinocarboxamide synthase